MGQRESDRSPVWVQFHSPLTSPKGPRFVASLTGSSFGIPFSDSVSALLPVWPHSSEMVKLERGCELKKKRMCSGTNRSL